MPLWVARPEELPGDLRAPAARALPLHLAAPSARDLSLDLPREATELATELVSQPVFIVSCHLASSASLRRPLTSNLVPVLVPVGGCIPVAQA